MSLASSVLLTVAVTAGCASDHEQLHRRAEAWKTALHDAVPAGTGIESAKAWGERNGVSFTYQEKHKQLYAIAERVPETGLNKFVCTEWAIILKITFSTSGISEGTEVSTGGVCL